MCSTMYGVVIQANLWNKSCFGLREKLHIDWQGVHNIAVLLGSDFVTSEASIVYSAIKLA